VLLLWRFGRALVGLAGQRLPHLRWQGEGDGTMTGDRSLRRRINWRDVREDVGFALVVGFVFLVIFTAMTGGLVPR